MSSDQSKESSQIMNDLLGMMEQSGMFSEENKWNAPGLAESYTIEMEHNLKNSGLIVLADAWRVFCNEFYFHWSKEINTILLDGLKIIWAQNFLPQDVPGDERKISAHPLSITTHINTKDETENLKCARSAAKGFFAMFKELITGANAVCFIQRNKPEIYFTENFEFVSDKSTLFDVKIRMDCGFLYEKEEFKSKCKHEYWSTLGGTRICEDCGKPCGFAPGSSAFKLAERLGQVDNRGRLIENE